MDSSTKRLPFVTLAVASLSGIFLVIGFATPYWVSSGEVHNGLWLSCRPDCMRFPAFVSGSYNYLNQIVFTVGFLLTVLSLIPLLVHVVYTSRRQIVAPLVVSIIFGIVSALVNLGGVVFIAIGIGVFGGPYSLSILGFSYAFVCVSGGLQIISVILSITMTCSTAPPKAYPGGIVMSPYQANS